MRGNKGRKVGKKEDGFGLPVFLMLLPLFLPVLQSHPKHLFAFSLQAWSVLSPWRKAWSVLSPCLLIHFLKQGPIFGCSVVTTCCQILTPSLKSFKWDPHFFIKQALPWVIHTASTSWFKHCLYYTLIDVITYLLCI